MLERDQDPQCNNEAYLLINIEFAENCKNVFNANKAGEAASIRKRRDELDNDASLLNIELPDFRLEDEYPSSYAVTYQDFTPHIILGTGCRFSNNKSKKRAAAVQITSQNWLFVKVH
mmetsp:Transcript_25292/g.39101  ORF Transcript_25292/g.39101 Transcript_25292/m.39101 type:complete len:117 (+) Transcript_25292:359-709(+)